MAAQFTVWAAVDERAHYAFVQSVAEDRRLPAITDLVSREVQAITDDTWPAPSPNDPADAGLAGRSYEAFQPPLYYALAAPAFAAVADHEAKVYALRAFDVVLYGASAAILFLIAMRIGGRHRWPAFAGGLLILLWPGLVVRGVTVSNAALEFVLVPAFLLAAWIAFTTRRPKPLVAAGALLGACLLTKLTLVYLAPTLLLAAAAVWRERRSASAPVALALPALALTPWLIDNLSRFGQLTANDLARAQQLPFLFPNGPPSFGVGDLPGRVAELLDGAVPQEWYGQLDVWWVGTVARGLPLLLVVAVVVALARRGQPSGARLTIAFFALPVVASLALMTATLLVEQWDIFLLRYVVPALPPLAIAAAAAMSPGQRRTLGVLATVLLGALWIDMAGAYLFLDVGDRLGI